MTPPAGRDATASVATQLLMDLRHGGDTGAQATAALTDLLYPELRRIAARLMRRERGNHTLQPTAVVHEAFLRLVDERNIDWQDRAHFFALCACRMRRILTDDARARQTHKRNGGTQMVALDSAVVVSADAAADVLAVDEALHGLARIDETGFGRRLRWPLCLTIADADVIAGTLRAAIAPVG